jgi:hypothetical protein
MTVVCLQYQPIYVELQIYCLGIVATVEKKNHTERRSSWRGPCRPAYSLIIGTQGTAVLVQYRAMEFGKNQNSMWIFFLI